MGFKLRHTLSAIMAAMPPAAMKILLSRPAVPAPLDPNFSPLVLGKRQYMLATKDCADELQWALPRADGCGRYTLKVFPEGHEDIEASIYLAGVLIQEMLWQRSASELLLAGPPAICEALSKAFAEGGAYEFEASSMPNVCGTPANPFGVKIVAVGDLPEAKDTPQVCGKDANGCRLAFDLGKSDIKVVAVKDNEVLYSKETEWDVTNPDPDYHYEAIKAAMQLGKDALPQIDAIGGSATGTVSGNNEATWCDIFPNVPRTWPGMCPSRSLTMERSQLWLPCKKSKQAMSWVSPWAAVREEVMQILMAISWDGSMSCVT